MGGTWEPWAHAGIVIAVGAAVVLLGGRIVTAVFSLADRVTSPPPEPRQSPIENSATTLRGGAWIGMLERLAIYAALLAHHPDGLAIALAVKGLARYPELKAPHSGVAERFIIGTFVSVLLACGAAGLTLWLTSLL